MPSTINATPTSSGLISSADASGVLALQTGGTTAVTIDGSQNVGIGTSSPVTKLTVTAGNGNAITSTNTGQQYSGFEIANNGSNRVTLQYDNTNGRADLNTRGSNPFTFGTSDIERMRIDSSGNLLVGTTTFATTPTQGVNIANTTSASVNIGHTTGTPSGFLYVNFGFNAGQIGSITQNGTTAVAYNTTSDYRLKENIAPLTAALTQIAALKPVTYTWKKAPDEIGSGFIAHELAEVCPQAVTGEKDAVDAEGNPQYQGIDTSFLVATLTAAIQEQQALITQLQADVAALKVQP